MNRSPFATAFDAFFSTRLVVTVNGQDSTRAALRDLLWDPKLSERSGTVNVVGAVQAATGEDEPQSVSFYLLPWYGLRVDTDGILLT